MNEIAAAYSTGASAWADGPTRVYGRLAELLVASSPIPLEGRLVLDVGSGTGLGSSAAATAGARVIAVDLALGMLRRDRARRPPAAVADATSLPFPDGAFDVALAPFCLNHLDDPAIGVAETGRIASVVVASTYAASDDHPVKAAVERALTEAGWEQPRWYPQVKTAMAAWGTVDGAAAVIRRGGLEPITVVNCEVPFPDLDPSDLVAWRLGLASTAGFVDRLDPDRRDRVTRRALDLLGPRPEPLVRHVIFLAASLTGRAH